MNTLHQDYRELLELFNAHRVEYLIVGGYALALLGAPRYTGDIDLFIKRDPENARRILESLESFGFGELDITVEDLQKPDYVIQLGFPPVRVDIITSISGVSWDEAYANREKGNYQNLEVFYIGKKEFIANKKASARKKDLADIEAIEKS